MTNALLFKSLCSGIYKIKSVKYSVSVDSGARQEIELDYKINSLVGITSDDIQKVISDRQWNPALEAKEL